MPGPVLVRFALWVLPKVLRLVVGGKTTKATLLRAAAAAGTIAAVDAAADHLWRLIDDPADAQPGERLVDGRNLVGDDQLDEAPHEPDDAPINDYPEDDALAILEGIDGHECGE